MRGKVKSLRGDGLHGGITPAHAGKRCAARPGCARIRDHPRTRGEKMWGECCQYWDLGSPPHTRGKDFLLRAPAHTSRITPARAGKSCRYIFQVFVLILSRLVDTFFSRISLTMQPPPKPHSTACVLPWEEGRHWQSRSSGCSSS